MSSPSSSTSLLRKVSYGILLGVGALVSVVSLLSYNQARLIYMKRRYPRDLTSPASTYYARAFRHLQATTGAKRLPFRTSQGEQVAFYVPPSSQDAPVWLTFGGNAALALDWTPFFDLIPREARPGFLLVDYPGYGQSGGEPSPDSIAESAQAALHAMLATVAPHRPRVSILGQSIGGAAALRLAADLEAADSVKVDSLVLLAPFTRMSEMVRELFGPIPLLTRFLKHEFDNREQLRRLLAGRLDDAARQPLHIEFFHGTADELVPFRMSKELYEQATSAVGDSKHISVHMSPIPRGSHNDLLVRAGRTIAESVFRACSKD